MPAPPPEPPGADLLEVGGLRLTEVAAPRPPAGERLAMDRLWNAAVAANPSLFDGPVVACAGLSWDGPRRLHLSWARTTYRHFLLRRVPGAVSWLPPLFVAVLQPDGDGRVVVGRSAATTAAPGRWQLPGGSAEPPDDGVPLDAAALRRHAARELVEETGLTTDPDALALRLVTRGRRGTVGVLYVAPARPASVLLSRHSALVRTETTHGRVPELDHITLVGSPPELRELDGPTADYLEPVIRRRPALLSQDAE
ncbi:NUDIX domain-containing protein [Streptomyces sp. RFCAC02]|uniref:NUDIX hydrolase n=1 Tax=Streptomyces sp. RFCAC02 TaxID=2499143 RepID=UPI00101F51EF|nr:NUDIX domain-containing protein [Streptomyces sp. RFCAC02]